MTEAEIMADNDLLAEAYDLSCTQKINQLLKDARENECWARRVARKCQPSRRLSYYRKEWLRMAMRYRARAAELKASQRAVAAAAGG